MPQFALGIITPTYNEGDNVRELIQQVYETVTELALPTLYLIVDDNSQDSTRNIVEEMIKEINDPNFVIKLYRRPGKMGLASAYIEGINMIKSECECIVSMDGDLSHPPRYLKEMMNSINGGADLVIGSRYVAGGSIRGWGLFRLFLSRIGSLYSSFVLWSKIHDFTGGYNMYRSSIFDRLDLNKIKAEGYLFQIEMKYRISQLGFKVVEVPIEFVDRVAGQSKISRRIILEAFFGIWKLKFNRL